MTSIQVFLNYDKPLEFEFENEVYEIANLNTFTFYELNNLRENIRRRKFNNWLSLYFPKEVLKALSQNQQTAIIEGLEENSGFKLSDVWLLFELIEKYPEELTNDLVSRNLTIFKLLELKPLEAVLAMKGLLKTNDRSEVIAKIRGWKWSFGQSDWQQADLWRLLLQVNSKNPNSVPGDVYYRLPMKKDSDINDELEKLNQNSEDELTEEEIEVIMENLRLKNMGELKENG